MPVWMCVFVLLVADILLALGLRWLERTEERQRAGECLPVSHVLAGIAAAFLAHMAASLPLAVAVRAAGLHGALATTASIFSGTIPAFFAARMLYHSLGDSVSEALFGMRTAKPLATDFSGARALVKRDDIDGALQRYREYVEENPEDPQPLFEATALLENERRYDEAAEYLREILRRYPDNERAITRAALRLGEILINRLGNAHQGCVHLRDAANRLPKSFDGQRARELLLQHAREASRKE